MVDTCLVTWTARDFQFATLASARLVFTPSNESALMGAVDVLYVPNRATLTCDLTGAGSIALVPGYYTLKVTTADFTATANLAVPDVATVPIGSCIDQILDLPAQSEFSALAASATASAATATTQASAASSSAAAAVADASAAEVARDGAVSARVGSEAAQAIAQDAQASAAAARDVAQAAASAAGAYADAAAGDATAAGASAATATTQATSASASAASAATSASAATGAKTAAETAQTGAQIAKSAAETAQTGAQTARTGAEAALMSAQTARTGAETARDVAQAQASLAAGYAASASSVVQQDLSGVTAQALHRSPNAITAMFIYDTSKDSDGGAWTERCQHTSWWNEAINGKWLGPQATEAAARAVSGATTGDYFQRTSDGRFFSLNAGSGITEVYRGNKRDFPRLAGIVAEGRNVTIYDLTEPGRPMWMTFAEISGSDTFRNFLGGLANRNRIQTVHMLNGVFAVSGPAEPSSNIYGHLRLASFADDAMTIFVGGYNYRARSHVGISERNATTVGFHATGAGSALQIPGSGLPDGRVNAVAMTVLPDAPVDPVTGLRVPTIAVATSGGVSLIRQNGSVENREYNAGAPEWFVQFDGPFLLVGGQPPDQWNGAYVWDIRDNAVQGYGRDAIVKLNNNGGSDVKLRVAGKSYAASQGASVNLLRHNKTAPAKAMLTRIAPTFNTGWMTGDIRRCFLSDVGAGSVVGPATVADRSYKAASATTTGTLTKAELASGTSLVGFSGWSAANYLREPYSADLDFGTGEWTANAWVNIPTGNAAAGTILSRAFSSGAYITLGIDATNKLTATAYDGTTTRTVTSSAAYNTATWLKVRVNYTTDGSLTLLVNGREVAATRGTPLATLNNASAVLTIGNSYDLAAPFPGSIALLKLGATVPTAEQAIFMFEQEKQLFRAGALSVLPDAGALVDMAYDAATDRWVALSAANESWWTGLVRNSVTAVPAGSYSRVAAGSGLELTARTTTSPGVDVTIPAYGLREELVNRAEAAARLSREIAVYDFVGGFTANTTNGSTAITSVAGLTYPTSYIGARVSGAGIPANTTITAVSGTTIYLSAAATATATGVSISFLDFNLPVGMEAKSVLSAGALRQEGSTKDYTRLFNGFLETIRFAVAPGATAWVQIQAARAAQ